MIAQDAGADGIFLINHLSTYHSLLRCYRKVREQFPNLWIGLNCLDLGRLVADYIPQDTAGLWVDNAGVNDSINPTGEAQDFVHFRRESRWEGIYFGGVAFKGQGTVADPAKVAKLAVPFVDVITTSGVATGYPPDLAKIRAMKAAIGTHPLAVASGLTPENVQEYMPYVDVYMVATGISDSHTELNPGRARALGKTLGK
jgi:hypothetical protein